MFPFFLNLWIYLFNQFILCLLTVWILNNLFLPVFDEILICNYVFVFSFIKEKNDTWKELISKNLTSFQFKKSINIICRNNKLLIKIIP